MTKQADALVVGTFSPVGLLKSPLPLARSLGPSQANKALYAIGSVSRRNAAATRALLEDGFPLLLRLILQGAATSDGHGLSGNVELLRLQVSAAVRSGFRFGRARATPT